MNPTNLSLAAQPFQGTDVIAFAMAVMGVISGVTGWRDRERGLGWFALGLLLMALFYAANDLHLPTDVYAPNTTWYLVVCAGGACLALGLARYLDLPPRLRWPLLLAMLTPVAIYLMLSAVAALGVQVHRAYSKLLVGALFASTGAVTWWAARREPGAGHGLIAIMLFGIAVLAIGLAIVDPNAISLRYWAPLPILALALTMLTTTLLRRRQALEAEIARRRAAEHDLTRANAALEQTVAERSAELQRLADGLESFNRSVSHDLRGALGSIATAAREAHEELQQGKVQFALSVLPLIAEQSAQLESQMSGLLSLALANDVALERATVDLAQLVREVVAQFDLELRDVGGLPRIEIAQDMPHVEADEKLLRPVLVNLIGNAIKFTRGVPAPRIEIGARPVDGEVEVSVRDNGVGFDVAATESLFKPFTRLHGAQFEGHGLGLSIVRRAIERHGGRVWAESRPGLGAVFRFRLPQAESVA